MRLLEQVQRGQCIIWKQDMILGSEKRPQTVSQLTSQSHMFYASGGKSIDNISLSSVQFSCSVMSNSLLPHESQHARPPCPSPTPGVHSDSRPSSQWCHPAISSSVIPFSSCLQSLPASESFPMSQLFAWGGQSIGVSALASFLPKNTQCWCPLEWTGWILICYWLLFPNYSRVNDHYVLWPWRSHEL